MGWGRLALGSGMIQGFVMNQWCCQLRQGIVLSGLGEVGEFSFGAVESKVLMENLVKIGGKKLDLGLP